MSPRKARFSLVVQLAAFVMLASAPGAQSPMPLEIHERLWERPGPVQSRPGAPKLLVVAPEKSPAPCQGRELRYMGRVEPAGAAVTLNGRPLKVWPGGVFSGRAALGGAGPVRWVFRATYKHASTTVERTIPLARPVQPPRPWPPAFYAVPVSPGGRYWIEPGETLLVTLYASPGARAQARIGEAGPWLDMQPDGEDARRGGRYTIELAPPPRRPAELAQVYFRLAATRGGQTLTRELAAPLHVGSRPHEDFFVARTTADFASYLLEPTDWERWGNLVRGTPAPFFEMRGDRVWIDFDHGRRGWLELSAVELPEAPAAFVLPRLEGRLDFEPDRQTLRLTLPRQTDPVAFTFEQQGVNRARLDLIGASTLRLTKPPATYGPIAVDRWTSGPMGQAPSLDFALARPLWGFGAETEPGGSGAFTLFVRAAPRLPEATRARPLAGLRIMLDAGHGGRDTGALGPSGLAESDVNLVEAAWLEQALAGMGAEVLQMRRADVSVDLDRRVAETLDFDPDLFISLHHNSVGEGSDPTAERGPVAFYHYEHSRPLAEAIEARLAGLWPGVAPLVKPQNFRVNRNISTCPSVLIETAYLCNPEDEIRLRDSDSIRLNAEAIAEGVKDYINSIR